MSQSWFDLQVVLAETSVDRFLGQLQTAVEGRSWPAVSGLASPASASPKLKPSKERDLTQLLRRVPGLCKDPSHATVGFGELSSLHWGQRPDGKSIYLGLSFDPAAGLFEDPAECVRALTHVARKLVAGGTVVSAAVERFDGGVCVPFVPLAKTRRTLVLTTDAEVADAYARPDEFWSAGWHIERFGEQRLLTRCQNVVEKGDVLRETRDHQWQMARAAKPKRTKYGPPTVEPDERELYEEGEATLYPVGRFSATGEVEYSCVLKPGDHVRGWEIHYLWQVLEQKQLTDGTPITGARVLFLEPWMAHSEKRPLLDINVGVYYDDASTGETVQVRE